MTRPALAPSIVLRLALLAAPACLLVADGDASGRDLSDFHYVPDANTFWLADGADPFDEVTEWYGPDWFGPEDPTGGVVFLDTSGGDAAEAASSMGFDVTWLYGGWCVADPGAATGMFDFPVLCGAINGMDPWADAEPDFFIEDPEGSQSNGVVLPSFFGRAQFVKQGALSSIRTNLAHKSASGAGVRIAVLDTGVDASHPFFDGRVAAGVDFVADGDERPDPAGHGTAVAGLVCAAAPGATILPVRVLDAGRKGTAARLAAGVRWAVDHDADVVNMSLGGRGFSQATSDAIAEGVRRRVVFVAAAGDDVAGRGVAFPASEPNVISVVARPGKIGDVWAPAARVSAPWPGNKWFRGNGTSFAAALVSGGAALAVGRLDEIDAVGVVWLLRPKKGPAHLDLVLLAK